MSKNKKVNTAWEAIRDALDKAVDKLSRAEYGEVLEIIQADAQCRLDCIAEEEESEE